MAAVKRFRAKPMYLNPQRLHALDFRYAPETASNGRHGGYGHILLLPVPPINKFPTKLDLGATAPPMMETIRPAAI